MATLRLGIDATKAKAGADQFTQATNKVEKGANRAASATDKLGSASAKGGKDLKRTGFLVNQASNQIGDLAVQVSMGTNVFRALGQQIPQLAGSFAILGGAMGIVLPILGVVPAIGFPIIAMFTQMGGKSQTLSEKMDKLSDSVEDFRDRVKEAKVPVEELQKEFGQFARQIRETRIELSILKIAEKTDEMNLALKEMAAVADFKLLGRNYKQMLLILAGGIPGLSILGDEFSSVAGQMADSFAISKEEAAELALALIKLGDPKVKNNPVKAAAAFDELGKVFLRLNPLTDDGTKKMLKLFEAMAKGEEQASALAIEFERLNKLQEKEEERRTTTRGQRGSGRPMSSGRTMIDDLSIEKDKGASGINSELKALENFAKKFKPVITLSQEYKNNLDKLNEARRRGAITEQEHAQAVAVATQQFQIGTGALIDYDLVANTFASSLSNNLMSVVDGTKSVKDAFRSLAVDVIKQLYRVLVVQQLVNAALGIFGYQPAVGGGYTKIPAITGTGAYGGPVTSGEGMVVGERGPEVFYPKSNGTIVPNNNSGDVTVIQNNTFGSGVSHAEINALMPKMVEATKAAVVDAKLRGGSYGRSFA